MRLAIVSSLCLRRGTYVPGRMIARRFILAFVAIDGPMASYTRGFRHLSRVRFNCARTRDNTKKAQDWQRRYWTPVALALIFRTYKEIELVAAESQIANIVSTDEQAAHAPKCPDRTPRSRNSHP